MVRVRDSRREPVTFVNAPTHDEDGIAVVDDDAALELAALVIESHRDLIEALRDR